MAEVFEGGSRSQPDRLRQTPSWLITQTATLTHRLVGAALTDIGATRYQYAVLAAGEFGPISQAEIGRRCHIDRSDVVATLNELAGHGRRPHAGPGRQTAEPHHPHPHGASTATADRPGRRRGADLAARRPARGAPHPTRGDSPAHPRPPRAPIRVGAGGCRPEMHRPARVGADAPQGTAAEAGGTPHGSTHRAVPVDQSVHRPPPVGSRSATAPSACRSSATSGSHPHSADAARVGDSEARPTEQPNRDVC